MRRAVLAILAVIFGGIALALLENARDLRSYRDLMLRSQEAQDRESHLKWGYIDETGHMVIAPTFFDAGDFNGGIARVLRKGPNGLETGFIDRSGKYIIAPQPDKGYGEISEGLIEFAGARKVEHQINLPGNMAFGRRGPTLWGYIDKTGKVVIAPRLEEVTSFAEGLAAVKLDGKWGYIDKTGKFAVAPRFADLAIGSFQFSEGLAAVVVGGKRGYIDKTGRMVIPPQFATAGSFHEGRAWVLASGFGYIDKKGRFTIPATFRQAGDFSEGLAAVMDINRVIYIDKTGKPVFKQNFGSGAPFHDGLAPQTFRGSWGFIDRHGTMVIPARFGGPSEFHEGRAFVDIGGRFGLIDKTGKIVLPPAFEIARGFHEGLAAVQVWLDDPKENPPPQSVPATGSQSN